jgi:hypothetical protein
MTKTILRSRGDLLILKLTGKEYNYLFANWLILCYVNFTSIKKKKGRQPEQHRSPQCPEQSWLQVACGVGEPLPRLSGICVEVASDLVEQNTEGCLTEDVPWWTS